MEKTLSEIEFARVPTPAEKTALTQMTQGALAASAVANDSSVAGATVKAALNTLLADYGSIEHALVYQDVWDCSHGVYPTPVSAGNFWICSVPGTIAGTAYAVNDWLVYGAAGWTKIDNTDLVISVFGRPGAVVAAASDYNASQVANDSSVAGTFVDDALDTLDTQIGTVSRVLHVDKNRGDTYTANGSIARPFKTIGAATAVATSGDLIKVVPSATDYAEDVVLPGGVSLEGYGANSLQISGDFDVVAGAPVSLRFLTLTGTAKKLTVTDAACALLDGYCYGRVVVAGTAIVQAWNFHIVSATAGVTPLTMASTGKFHAFMASISSNGNAPAINQSAGTIILNTILASAGRAADPVILSTGGTCAFLGAQAINSLGGPAVDMSANGADASNPNLIADLVAVGNVVCGAKATTVEGLKFVSVGALTGTLLEFRPSSRVGYAPAIGANWVDADPVTVAEAIDRIAAEVVALKGGPIA